MRSSDVTDNSHILPQPPKNPWNSSSLAWTTSYAGLMEFSAQQIPNSFHPTTSFQHHKRKSNFSPPLPTKQLITEDKMAAHLNSLHISNDFTAHNANTSTEEPIPGTSTAINDNSDSMDENLDYIYTINNTNDLKEKLKRANRITVCNEIKNIQPDDNILPKALLNHYQKPCTALVVWQPPQKVLNLIGNSEENDSDYSDTDENIVNDIANNKIINLNNYSMDTDL